MRGEKDYKKSPTDLHHFLFYYEMNKNIWCQIKDGLIAKKLTSRECSLFVYFSFIASHLNSHAGGGEGGEMVPSLKKNVTAFVWISSKH